MFSFFKREPKAPAELEVEELMKLVRSRIEARGGFAVIGLNGDKVNGHPSIHAGAFTHDLSRHKAMFTCAQALGKMDALEVMLTMMRYSPSQTLIKSPIQAADLGKGGEK